MRHWILFLGVTVWIGFLSIPTIAQTVLPPNGDAAGDGCTNHQEYDAYVEEGTNGPVHTVNALNPAVHPEVSPLSEGEGTGEGEGEEVLLDPFVSGSNDSNISIPEYPYNPGIHSHIDISGVPSSAVVKSVTVSFACVHPFGLDLTVALYAPSGSAEYILWSNSPGVNPSKTESGIIAFNGLPVNGSWDLYVRDDYSPDTGYLDSWSILIYYDVFPCTSSDPGPVLSNVQAQQFGSFVRVTYDAVSSAAFTLVPLASMDAGLSYPIVPNPSRVYPPTGTPVQPGFGLMTLWDIFNDLPDMQIPEAKIYIRSCPDADASSSPESNLFTVDTCVNSLGGGGLPFDIFDLDQNGTNDILQDFDGDGAPDAFTDTDDNGIPDAYQDLNYDDVPDGFEDGDGNGTPDWFETRLPLFSPSHPYATKWYFSPDVIIEYPNYMAGTALNGYLWTMDQSENTVVDTSATFRPTATPETVEFTASASGSWYFHIAAVGTDTLIIAGSQRNLKINVYLDGFFVSSTSHPDSEIPSLNKTFNAAVSPAIEPAVWSEQTTNADWSARYGLKAQVFQNKIWILGGGDGYSNYNDIWSSQDGKSWTQEVENADWSKRGGHAAVVFQDKLWVLGGYELNDVWSSPDGMRWTLETENAGWSPRGEHQAVVFKNKLWVLGGSGDTYYNDVWSSPDGRNWTQETSNSAWSSRSSHQTVVFHDKLWVLGGWFYGGPYNDIWSSSDGNSWIQETANAPWSERDGHRVVVFQNKLWLMGGGIGWGRLKDIWSSSDGKTWVQETINAVWSARCYHEALVFQNTIWILGGNVGYYSNLNDVWSCTWRLPYGQILGCYYLHDANDSSVPDESDQFSESTDITIPGSECPPGTHWFHVSAIDAAGHLSPPAHYKFMVTDAPPTITSPTHPNPNIPGPEVAVTFQWNSGGVPDIVKYWYAWGTNESVTPAMQTTNTSITFDCVVPGVYWFIIQSEDTWGFKSSVAKRKVMVGATPAPVIASSTHPDIQTNYAARDVNLTWTPYSGSGAPYYYVWDQVPDTPPSKFSTSTDITTLTMMNVSIGVHYLHLCATDLCGALTTPVHFAVHVREAMAPQVTITQESNGSTIGFTWTDPDDFAAGTPKYYLAFDQDPATQLTAESAPHSTENMVWNEFGVSDGIHYFHIRGKDVHGNLSAQADSMVVAGGGIVLLSPPSPMLTNTGLVFYTVSYPGAVTINLNPALVSLNKSGTANGFVSVGDTEEPTVKQVVVSDIMGDGSLSISIAAGSADYESGGTAPAIGPSIAFTVDNTAPEITMSAPFPSLTSTGPVICTVTYTGADEITLAAENISLQTVEGNATGTIFLNVTGTAERTITVDALSGNGVLRISIPSGSAYDLVGNQAHAANSETFTVDNIPPQVTLGPPSPPLTNSGPVEYQANYVGAQMISLAPEDVTLESTPAGAVTGTVAISGDGTSMRTIRISDITGDGTLKPILAPATARDLAGNNAMGAEGTAFTTDNTPPTITISEPSSPSSSGQPITYTVTYQGASEITLAETDITVEATGDAVSIAHVSEAGVNNRLVTLSSPSGYGTIGISIGPGTARDEAGNLAESAGPSETFNVSHYTLLIEVNGSGTTAPSPGSYLMQHDDQVTLEASPDSGWGFVQWIINGQPYDEKTLDWTIAGDTHAVAYFERMTHNADQNGDHIISLSEMLRVIQFFNSGGHHCQTGTEDGFAPGPGDTSCTAHQSDYNPQDWFINLSELLRLIQFFNSGGYHACTGSEDGYCPGLS